MCLCACSFPTLRQPNPSENWLSKVISHHQQTEGGRLLLQSMAAHGGLGTWLESEVLHFRWTYHMNDKGPKAVIDTIQDVDVLSLQAVHTTPNKKLKFGWDGQQAWIHPADAKFDVAPRFWSLTPFYFVAIPFVFADLSTTATLLEDTLQFGGRAWQQVKITYAKGAGDAPDDYYILLIDPSSKQIGAARYIVTHKLIAQNGPLPEKLITLEGQTEINGLLLPTLHRSFEMNQGKVGKQIRTAEVSEIEFKTRAQVNFDVPTDSKKL